MLGLFLTGLVRNLLDRHQANRYFRSLQPRPPQRSLLGFWGTVLIGTALLLGYAVLVVLSAHRGAHDGEKRTCERCGSASHAALTAYRACELPTRG
jgi:hypothetical protein